ncbi:hypothetical protein MRX96_000667 [Rhipicephalus microplus]
MSLRSFRFTRSAAKAEMSKDMGVKEEPSHETEPFKDDLSLQQQPRPEAIRADAQQATVTAPPAKHEQTAVKDEQKVKASAGPCETEDSDSRLSPTELIDPVTGFLTPDCHCHKWDSPPCLWGSHQPSMSLGQPPLGVWVGPRPPIGPQYPSSFTSLTGQQHLVRGVHPSVVRTPSLPQQEAANKMPGAAHAMVGGPNPSQVHCSQPKMEGPASQLSAQQPHHHPQQHIQGHRSDPRDPCWGTSMLQNRLVASFNPHLGVTNPQACPEARMLPLGGSTGVAPPGGGVIAELLQNPHLMQQHKNYQLAVAASQYMGGGPLGRPGASLHVGGPNPTATPPQELLHLRPTPGQQLLVAGHLGMHTPELSAYMHHQQMLYAAAQQHPHYALPPEAQGLRFAYPTGGFRAPPEPREGITKEGRPPPPLKGSDAEPTVAEGAPKEVPSKELLRPPFPPLRQTSPRVASSPQERVTDSPRWPAPTVCGGPVISGPRTRVPPRTSLPSLLSPTRASMNRRGAWGGSPPFLHSPGGALALKKEADVAKKGVSFDRRQTGLEAPLHLGPPPAHALAPPPAAPRSQPQTPPHASQVPPQGGLLFVTGKHTAACPFIDCPHFVVCHSLQLL